MRSPFRRTSKEKKMMENEKTMHDKGAGLGTEEEMEQANGPDTADMAAEGQDSGNSNIEAELDILRTEHQALHDKHLRLFAEFDNFRKRTAKERLELIQFAGENSIRAILPVLDDMGRAITNNEQSDDIASIKEGIKLIHQKMQHLLASQGLKPMEVKKGDPFDTDKHEAITKAPAENDKLKGAIIDVVESGYLLNDKVIRYAKVVVGE